MDDLKIYLDKDLRNLAPDPLDLGKVKIGDTKIFTYYLYNTSVYPYEELESSINREEVKIILSPTELSEKTSAKIILEWKPLTSTRLKVKPKLEVEGLRVEPL